MMRMRRLLRTAGASVFSFGLLCGCSGLFDQPPLQFYTLTAEPAPATTSPSRSGPIFAIAPVRLPQYLSQRAIVTRTGPTQLDLSENHVWAGPLVDAIGSVLSENISTMIPSDRVVELPVSAAIPVDYEVRVKIVSFERQPDGAVELVARWTVVGGGGTQLMAVERAGYQVRDVPFDYASITVAMSSLLTELSRDIASALRSAAAPYPMS